MSGANATLQRKGLDSRIPTLISNSLQTSHRSFFLMVGDRAKAHAQIVNLHILLTQAMAGLSNPTDAQKKKPRPNLLWCYKKDLGFSTHRKQRESKIKREIKSGKRDAHDMSPFDLFVSTTDIRYAYYKETDRILGQTFNMLVLQDFEALTPNLLARTIETVEGGGIVVCLLQGMTSLRGLYSMTMDVHANYRSHVAQAAPVARFNERFLLSLGANPACLVVDDELNVLPISAGKDIAPLDADTPAGGALIGVGRSAGKGKRRELPGEEELVALQASLRDTPGIGPVIALARTLDQAKAVLTFTDALTARKLSQTVSLTAGRGRGKSAALGLALSLAVLHSYANIFVTSPSPENLSTLFAFVLKGFSALGWEEHLDYDVVASTDPAAHGAVVRINIFRQHRQTIQYIAPEDAHTLGQAELLVIDEAAAIPLPRVRALLGPYLVFLASTINGYEGTGRSLSLKLLQQLREGTRSADARAATRTLTELTLETPVRYAPGDAVEAWLNSLLCLDAAIGPGRGAPHPDACELFFVDRDALFSHHAASEAFLQRMMALYVASHYKNTPNDLQLLADAPGQQLFVLLRPPAPGDTALPEPLAVVQIALEGHISRDIVRANLARGKMAAGDLIPWTITQQFQDDDFASLSGARIVRIAVHPSYVQKGYGARCVELLNRFYSGELVGLSEGGPAGPAGVSFAASLKDSTTPSLHTETITHRDAHTLPPLLQRLSERRPDALDYLGVSFGVTASLFRFWKKCGFVPLYVRQTPNDTTGEHTAVLLRGLNKNAVASAQWLGAFASDFRKRFLTLLSFRFREFGSVMALSIADAASAGAAATPVAGLVRADIDALFSPFDIKRLTSYTNNMLDYHVILDLLPALATLYFSRRFPADVSLSGLQAAILLALGLQRKSVDDVETELGLPATQILALFVKTLRKFVKAIEDIRKNDAEKSLGETENENFVTLRDAVPTQTSVKSLTRELEEEGEAVIQELREKQREVIDSLDLQQYRVAGTDEDWEKVQKASHLTRIQKDGDDVDVLPSVVSIKNADSTKKNKRKHPSEDKDSKRHKSSKSSKDKKRSKK